MKTETKNMIEASAITAAGNAAVWTAQDVSLTLQIVLAAISILWLSTQLCKFCLTWWREEVAKHHQNKAD